MATQAATGTAIAAAADISADDDISMIESSEGSSAGGGAGGGAGVNTTAAAAVVASAAQPARSPGLKSGAVSQTKTLYLIRHAQGVHNVAARDEGRSAYLRWDLLDAKYECFCGYSKHAHQASYLGFNNVLHTHTFPPYPSHPSFVPQARFSRPFSSSKTTQGVCQVGCEA